MEKRPSKINIILVIILSVLVLSYAFFKYFNFYSISKNMMSIDYNEMLDYADIYFYTYNKYPEDATNFNLFLKKYNLKLYSNLKKIDYHPFFSNDNNRSFSGFYANGFDRENDSLKNQNYVIDEINFFKSINFNGDLFFKVKKQRKTYKTNTIYKLKGGSLVKIKIVPLEKIYKTEFDCERIKLKKLLDIETKFVLFRLSNDKIDYYNHAFANNSTFSDNVRPFSNKSLQIFSKELKDSECFVSKNDILIVFIKYFDIEDFECFEKKMSSVK